MAPNILIFSIAMGADYSFELISIETYAPQFIGHNKFFLGSVGKRALTRKIIDNLGSNYVMPILLHGTKQLWVS